MGPASAEREKLSPGPRLGRLGQRLAAVAVGNSPGAPGATGRAGGVLVQLQMILLGERGTAGRAGD